MEQWTGRGDLLRARRWKKRALDVADVVDGKWMEKKFFSLGE